MKIRYLSLIVLLVIGRMVEYGFQIEVNGTGDACGHIIVKFLEAPCHPYFLVAADLQKPGSDTQKQADTDNADHCGHTPDKVIYYIVDLFYRL